MMHKNKLNADCRVMVQIILWNIHAPVCAAISYWIRTLVTSAEYIS
jgi:hypothetical protein